MGLLMAWLTHYGYVVLLFALFLEMLALPLPGEFLMSYTGLMVFEGKLNWILSILFACSGVICGITASYFIGYRLGEPFFEKHGAKFHLGPEQMDRVSVWFDRYGNKLLFIAYFIPGVRHVTGYFCGVSRMPYRKFALVAYSGALFWTSVFISFGKVLGPKWEAYHHTLNRYMILFGLIAAGVFLLVYLYRKYRRQILDQAVNLLDRGLERFHSIGRVKFVVISAFAVFVLFFSLMIGLIQDFLANEFARFDEVAFFIVHQVFDSSWTGLMSLFAMLGSYYTFVPLIVVTGLWIGAKGKDRSLEMIFFAFVIIGGEGLDEGLRLLFHRTGPAGSLFPYTFPSEQTLISLTVCGFAAFLLVRHYGGLKTRIAAILTVAVLCLLVGISRVFFNVQYPSDVVAGYVFGGAWISLNVILLEIFRILRNDKFARRQKYAT